MHEGSNMHEDTFAWVENFIIIIFLLLTLIYCFFYVSITITPNPYPRWYFFNIFNQFFYFLVFFY